MLLLSKNPKKAILTALDNLKKLIAPLLIVFVGLTSYSVFATESLEAVTNGIDDDVLAQEIMPIIYSLILTPPTVQNDTDDDGINDSSDNCLELANPTQLDTDTDGFGNGCDADLDNSCTVNFLDLSIFSGLFLSEDPDADFNEDGAVNFLDFIVLKNTFTAAPGPSGIANVCSS